MELTATGYGLDCMWADDFHHQVRVLVAGDRESWFSSFTGSTRDLAETMNKGWFFTGQKLPHQERNRGTVPRNALLEQCCVSNNIIPTLSSKNCCFSEIQPFPFEFLMLSNSIRSTASRTTTKLATDLWETD